MMGILEVSSNLSILNMTKSVLFCFQFCKDVPGSCIPGVGPHRTEVCKPCSCPVSRLKKEPRYSNRDINGLLDKGTYMSEAKVPGATLPLWMAGSRQATAAVFATWWRKRLPFIGGIDVRWAHQLPGKPGAGGKHAGSY